MSETHSIVLIGPMGAGKTTIGRQLAAVLKYQFIDTDRVIEERTGADISWIFDVEGEGGFRKRETAVLEELAGASNTVIATGGGIVMREQNREVLKRMPNVVYLTAGIQRLIERTSKDKKRPLLQVENPAKRIAELLEQRDPLYREVADIVVNTESFGAKTIVDEIIRRLDL